MTDSEYFALNLLSQSTLKSLRSCLKDCLGDVENGFALFQKLQKIDKQTKSMEFGTALHCAVLEPQRFEKEYKFYTGKSNSKANELLFEESIEHGFNLLTMTEYDKVIQAKAALFENKKINELFDNPFLQFEKVIQFEYLDTQFKSKIDIIDFSSDTIYDLKTTKSINPKSLYYAVSDYGYDIQKHIYQKAVEITYGRKFDFKFIFIENTAPFYSRIATLSDNWNAEKEVKELVEIYNHYKDSSLEFSGFDEIEI
jgi:hypothetical protein